MKRPRYSHCPEGQQFIPGRTGKWMPSHTPALGSACRCAPCRMVGRWTTETRAARSAEYKARCAEHGPLRPPGPQSIASRWLPSHEQALSDLLGTMDTAGIAEELTRRFGWPRTETAVRERIKVLKWSRLSVRPWSRAEVARALGVSYERVRDWVRAGMLTGTPWKLGGGQRAGHVSQVFAIADVERFLREYPQIVPLGQVRHSGLRILVIALSRGQAVSA